MPPFRLMLFDPYEGGHHGQYIEQLVRYWLEQDLPGALDVVVPPGLLERQASLVDLAEAHAARALRLHRIDVPIPQAPAGLRELVRSDLAQGRLVRRYAERLRPDHVLLMTLDHLQVSLALGLRFDYPVTFSGIYFRPSFHYGLFDDGGTASLGERLQRRRKRVQLDLALRNPHVSHLFSLDPFVVPHVEAFGRRAQPVFLPDGATFDAGDASREEVRRRWGVPPDGVAALMFGVLDGRKGLFALLEALRRLPARCRDRLTVVLSGLIPEGEREAAYALLERVRAEASVTVLLDDRFIDPDEIQPLIRGADLVLLPYQQHVGSSNVLIRAAAERRPVLGAAFGLLGEQIRRRRLGTTVDAGDAQALADALAGFVDDPASIAHDPEEARRFAEENTAARFAETIFKHILPPSEDSSPADQTH